MPWLFQKAFGERQGKEFRKMLSMTDVLDALRNSLMKAPSDSFRATPLDILAERLDVSLKDSLKFSESNWKSNLRNSWSSEPEPTDCNQWISRVFSIHLNSSLSRSSDLSLHACGDFSIKIFFLKILCSMIIWMWNLREESLVVDLRSVQSANYLSQMIWLSVRV